jgi:hypothetical protein
MMERIKSLYRLILSKSFLKFFCTLKAGEGDGVSFLGLFAPASPPLFFTAVFESRTSDIFCLEKTSDPKNYQSQ